MDLAFNNLQRLMCHKTKPNSLSYLEIVYISKNTFMSCDYYVPHNYPSFFINWGKIFVH